MAAWKVVALAVKAHRTWRRLPPARRRQLVEQARHQAAKHGPAVAKTVREQGPVVAKRVGDAVREARKRPRP